MSEKCSIRTELNDIRSTLDKIPDTALALDLLEKLENAQAFQESQSAELEKIRNDHENLKTLNQTLLLRVASHNTQLQPTTDVNYNEIDNTQTILDAL